jgi:hypothetical protein|tara:strand:+ start:158 stop:472 length:315 start_codon:yes stop_codon:yes gene_type:complete
MTPEKRMSLDIQSLQSFRLQKPIDETIARNSKSVLTPKNNLSALHDIKNNPFNSPIVKDIKKTRDINLRKYDVKTDMNQIIDRMTPKEFVEFESDVITFKMTNV